MKYPRILSAEAIDNHTLVIEFDNKEKKKYDITLLSKKKMFSSLKNRTLFKAVRVEQDGHAVVWDSNVDISEYELRMHGQPMS